MVSLLRSSRTALITRHYLWAVPRRRHGRNGSTNSTSSAHSLIRVTNIPAPHAGSIRILSLNRPEARNAISRQLLAELAHETSLVRDEGESGATRAMILGSEVDACFCAGADLKERAGFSQQEYDMSPPHFHLDGADPGVYRTTDFLERLRNTFTSIQQLPIPTIAAVASLALGGGLELALAASMRVFSSTAVVRLPETRLGIIPGAGGTHRLPALVGLNRARDLILTGRRVSGPEAYFLGLCDRLVEVRPEADEKTVEPGRARELVLAEAVRLAREICEGAPLATRAAKRAVEGWQDAGEAEDKAYESVMGTADRNEALAAFREKRPPQFRGR
ncbi:MAG: hypothetical protein M1832_005581 [Thelocarpon impressellum]|nr:MAG: hypothetical protein M1832_005581 [Thelocarpon impressellum]